MKIGVAGVLFLVGCGSSSSAKPDAPPDAVGFPAFQPSVPQIIHVAATPTVIANPTFVAVYFPNDTQQTGVDTYLPAFVASPVWSALSEYGVGAATIGTSITLTDTPPATAAEADVESFLAGKLDGTHPEFGPVDTATLASKVFVLMYSSATTLKLQNQNVCPSINGYHLDTALTSGAHVNLVVVPRCDMSLDTLTSSISYGLPAAATDPLIAAAPQGWEGYDPAHAAWSDFGGEVSASTCSSTMVAGHETLRMWSNASAAAYHDPCIPAVSPYFVAAPVPPDTIANAGTGVTVPVSGSKTIDVQLFSDAPTSGPWTVTASTLSGDESFTLDHPTGKNGDVLHLTITGASVSGRGVFVVASVLGTTRAPWLVPVQVQ